MQTLGEKLCMKKTNVKIYKEGNGWFIVIYEELGFKSTLAVTEKELKDIRDILNAIFPMKIV